MNKPVGYTARDAALLPHLEAVLARISPERREALENLRDRLWRELPESVKAESYALRAHRDH